MPKPVLIIGGGISGIQAALDLAKQKIEVYLVEKEPSIGGKMAQLDKTFPTLDCSSCILTPKMNEIIKNKNIKLLTYSEVKEIKGKKGNFKVKIVKKARYVNIDICTGCRECLNKCPAKGPLGAPDEFNLGMNKRKAIYFYSPYAIPAKPVIDPKICLYFLRKSCRICEKVCPTGAIDFNQKDEEIEIEVASIIIATGFSLQDPTKESLYGYKRFSNVFTSLEFERLLSSTGPTSGEILRRSDKKVPKKIAFIQCVCSRNIKINPQCSAFCCTASIKHAILAKEHIPEVECTIFFMDLRLYGKGYQEFYTRAKEEFNIKFIRAKPSRIEENDEKDLIITYEDTVKNKIIKEKFNMIVLAVGIKPNFIPLIDKIFDEEGYVKKSENFVDPVSTQVEGIFSAGVISGSQDIPDSIIQGSAAALKASIIAKGG